MSDYPSHLFTGARLKVERSYAHFENLKTDAGAFWKRNPHRIVHELDADGGQKHIRVRINEHPPAIWGTIIGDVVHNLRSALDLLATDLARASGHTSNTALKGTYFPVAADRQEFETAGHIRDKIKRLSPADREHITALKPYRGGNDLLWKLHQLDILDKHTLLVPAICGLQQNNPGLFLPGPIGPGTNKSVEMKMGYREKFPLEDGDILASYPATQPESSVEVEATFTIAFGQGQVADGEPVLPTLLQFGQLVDEIIKSFEARRSAP